MRPQDSFDELVEALNKPLQEILGPSGTCFILRVASCANMIRHKATIQLTIMEFVIGNPRKLVISSAFCERPCSSFTEAPAAKLSCSELSLRTPPLSGVADATSDE